MRRLKLLSASFALVILLPVAASAYTLILLSGRSIEIPANFSVTRAGITYEHAPGLYVTIQMTSIDIAATERANNEPQGSLLRRAAAKTASTPPASANASPRTLTDRELEQVRRRREASEAVYERRRAELGLPSVEETRRQREEETRRLNELAAQAEAGKAESESYWRARAAELRTAISVNDAEINYLRSKLREMNSYSGVSFTTIAPFAFVARVPGRIRGHSFPYTRGAPFVPRGVGRRELLAGGIRFGGGSTRGRINFNPRGSYSGYARPTYSGQGVLVLPLPVYATYGYDQSYEQSMIAVRLRELEAEQAGLQARWRLLEDEARRAGAPPGWLRP
ncbi:MAG TPA: hypothetical protein VF543_09965 [Pyrinomonadaceae bacterium]